MISKPAAVWLIIGHRPATKIRRLPYSTDPRDYDLPDMKPMTDDEYANLSNIIKVFSKADDAIAFVYDCGLLTTMCIGFRLVDGVYKHDTEVSDEVLDIDW